MSDDDPRVIVVQTGDPLAYFVACLRCGVLLWDADSHYATTHPDPETSDL